MMSSANEKKDNKFVERFIEVCGTSQPAKISKNLKISYQAAKNYLNGRLPDSKTLITIANKTPYSIHWLLTGKGNKLIKRSNESGLILFLKNLKQSESTDFLVELGEFLEIYLAKNGHTSINSPKRVILPTEKIRNEKVKEENSSNLPINPS